MAVPEMENFADWSNDTLMELLDAIKYEPALQNTNLRVGYVRGLINEIIELRLKVNRP